MKSALNRKLPRYKVNVAFYSVNMAFIDENDIFDQIFKKKYVRIFLWRFYF